MAKNGRRYYKAGELKTEVLIYFAENAPPSINQVAKALSRSYKNIYDIVKSHEAEGLLQRFGDRYWLTGRGIEEALSLGADPDKVKRVAPAFYLGEELNGIAQICDFRRTTGPEMWNAVMAFMNGETLDLGGGVEKFASLAPRLGKFFNLHPELKPLVKEKVEPILNDMLKQLLGPA